MHGSPAGDGAEFGRHSPPWRPAIASAPPGERGSSETRTLRSENTYESLSGYSEACRISGGCRRSTRVPGPCVSPDQHPTPLICHRGVNADSHLPSARLPTRRILIRSPSPDCNRLQISRRQSTRTASASASDATGSDPFVLSMRPDRLSPESASAPAR